MFLQLSTDQHSAIQGICDTLLNPADNHHALAILTGSAGTGKTTVVSYLIEEANKRTPERSIKLCASTHRAAHVLSTVVGDKVTTIHKLFGLRPSVTKFGKEVLKNMGTAEFARNTLVIIDESSMIGNNFLKAIAETVQKRGLKVLFVGDPFQLPPTKDICSLFDESIPTFQLTKVHRQALGNPILAKATQFRDYIRGDISEIPKIEQTINDEGDGIHVMKHEDFVTEFVKKYLGYSAGDEVDIPMCTYTNASAINYNSMIRKATFFLEGTIEPFYIDERLISNSAVMLNGRIAVANNEPVHVISFANGTYEDILGWNVLVRRTEGANWSGDDKQTVFVPRTKGEADKALEALKKKVLSPESHKGWHDYYALKNALADLRPPFAGTTHKAQGGTFPAVFIDQTNINKCRDPLVKAKLLYVALTRATHNVYVNS